MRFLLVAVVLTVAVALVHSEKPTDAPQCLTTDDCTGHHGTVCDSTTHPACLNGACSCISAKRSGEACQTVADCPACAHDGHVAHCDSGHCHCSAH